MVEWLVSTDWRCVVDDGFDIVHDSTQSTATLHDLTTRSFDHFRTRSQKNIHQQATETLIPLGHSSHKKKSNQVPSASCYYLMMIPNNYGATPGSSTAFAALPILAGGAQSPALVGPTASMVLEGMMLTSVILNSMSAGIVFIFSNTIMPSLAKLDSGFTTMVTINEVILNPLFKLIFVGGLLFSGIPFIHMMWGSSKEYYSKPARYLALASTLVYFLGQLVITATQNVPRNNVLLDLSKTSSSGIETYWRNEYLTKWVSWNTARCVFATVSSILGGLALRFMAAATKGY